MHHSYSIILARPKTHIRVYMPCPHNSRKRKGSRHSLQVLVLVHLFVRFAISPELVLPFAQDLVDFVRLRVHPTGALVVDNVSLFVQFDRLRRHMSQ